MYQPTDFTNGAKRLGRSCRSLFAMKDGRPFTFAGLWEGWKDPESGEWLRTCTIITGEPNEFVRADPSPYGGGSSSSNITRLGSGKGRMET